MKAIATVAIVLSTALGSSAATADEVKLRFAVVTTPNSGLYSKFAQPWTDRVNAAGKGVVSIETTVGMKVANYTNIYDRVLNDVVQVGYGLQNLIGGKFPLTAVAGLPFGTETAEESAVALYRLYKSGALDAEYDAVVPLALTGFPQARLHMTSPLKTLDNLDGLKMMVTNKVQGEALAKLGATSLVMPISDIYTALQRETVNGVAMAWAAMWSYKAGEVANYHVDARLGSSTAFVFMSRKVFGALPAAVRKVLNDHAGEGESRAFGAFWDTEADEARTHVMALKNNQQIVSLSPAQSASWKARIDAVVQEWRSSHPDGAKVHAQFQKLLADVRTGS